MHFPFALSSNNTNKLSPQELSINSRVYIECSNNTNKLSPQERKSTLSVIDSVQIIQINLVLKNFRVSELMTVLFK